jgi:hypothetical protein
VPYMFRIHHSQTKIYLTTFIYLIHSRPYSCFLNLQCVKHHKTGSRLL